MSIRIMTLIWENEDEWLSGSRRLVLLALADNANDEAVCWPSINTIAKKCVLSRRYVMEILAELEDKRYILRHQRDEQSTMYTIIPSAAGRTSAPERTPLVSQGALPSAAGRTILVRPGAPEPSIEPLINSSIEPSIPAPPAHLTNGQVFFRDLFGMKRLNQVQLKAIADLETKYGWANFKAAAEWARLNNFPAGKAISSMTTALPKWGQAKGSNGGDKWAKDRVSKEARSRYAEE